MNTPTQPQPQLPPVLAAKARNPLQTTLQQILKEGAK